MIILQPTKVGNIDNAVFSLSSVYGLSFEYASGGQIVLILIHLFNITANLGRIFFFRVNILKEIDGHIPTKPVIGLLLFHLLYIIVSDSSML